MYDIKPNMIIGFHGCEASVRDALLNNPNEIKISRKPFDWLGHGMYFWENNYERALQWAQDKKSRGAIKEPAVIGAVLYLGYCCDFLDSKYIRLLAQSFDGLEERSKESLEVIPSNKDIASDPHKDRILRHLDCAVIEYMHVRIFAGVQRDIQTKKGLQQPQNLRYYQRCLYRRRPCLSRCRAVCKKPHPDLRSQPQLPLKPPSLNLFYHSRIEQGGRIPEIL